MCDDGWAAKGAGRTVCLQDRVRGGVGALTAGDLRSLQQKTAQPSGQGGLLKGARDDRALSDQRVPFFHGPKTHEILPRKREQGLMEHNLQVWFPEAIGALDNLAARTTRQGAGSPRTSTLGGLPGEWKTA